MEIIQGHLLFIYNCFPAVNLRRGMRKRSGRVDGEARGWVKKKQASGLSSNLITLYSAAVTQNKFTGRPTPGDSPRRYILRNPSAAPFSSHIHIYVFAHVTCHLISALGERPIIYVTVLALPAREHPVTQLPFFILFLSPPFSTNFFSSSCHALSNKGKK